MTTKVKDRSTTFKFTLIPDRSPKAIDVEMDGSTGEGIYALDGDTLKIVHTAVGEARPTEFATKQGTSLTLMILQRVQP